MLSLNCSALKIAKKPKTVKALPTLWSGHEDFIDLFSDYHENKPVPQSNDVTSLGGWMLNF